MLRWLFWDNLKLTGCMATYRYNRTFTPKPDPNVLAFYRKRIDDYLSVLDRHLQDRSFKKGARPTVAESSMMAYTSFPNDEIGCDLAVSHPAFHTPGPRTNDGRMLCKDWRTAISMGRRLTLGHSPQKSDALIQAAWHGPRPCSAKPGLRLTAGDPENYRGAISVENRGIPELAPVQKY